jgi:hypothetical protein
MFVGARGVSKITPSPAMAMVAAMDHHGQYRRTFAATGGVSGDAGGIIPRREPLLQFIGVRPHRSFLLVLVLVNRQALCLMPASDSAFTLVQIGGDLLPGFEPIPVLGRILHAL